MERITIKEAAALLGASEQWVRLKCKAGSLGEAYGAGKERKHYMISPAMLAGWNGWNTDRVFEELEKLRGKS